MALLATRVMSLRQAIQSMKNIIKAPQSFCAGVKKEWNKIKWPTKATIARQAFIVIIISAMIVVTIALVDAGALRIISHFF